MYKVAHSFWKVNFDRNLELGIEKRELCQEELTLPDGCIGSFELLRGKKIPLYTT